MYHGIPPEWLFNASGVFYEITSGPIIVLSAIAIGWKMLRSRNCHSKGCWRIGTHDYEMDGVTHRLCRKCHPALKGRSHTRAMFYEHHAAKAKNL